MRLECWSLWTDERRGIERLPRAALIAVLESLLDALWRALERAGLDVEPLRRSWHGAEGSREGGDGAADVELRPHRDR